MPLWFGVHERRTTVSLLVFLLQSGLFTRQHGNCMLCRFRSPLIAFINGGPIMTGVIKALVPGNWLGQCRTPSNQFLDVQRSIICNNLGTSARTLSIGAPGSPALRRVSNDLVMLCAITTMVLLCSEE